MQLCLCILLSIFLFQVWSWVNNLRYCYDSVLDLPVFYFEGLIIIVVLLHFFIDITIETWFDLYLHVLMSIFLIFSIYRFIYIFELLIKWFFYIIFGIELFNWYLICLIDIWYIFIDIWYILIDIFLIFEYFLYI